MPSTPLAINRPDPLVPQFRNMPISTITITPPVQFTVYDILPTTSDVRVLYVTVMQSNTGVAVENIVVATWADGVALGNTIAAASGQLYYVYLDEDADVLLGNINVTGVKTDFAWYAQSMRVAFWQSSGVGPGATMTGTVRYEQL